MMPFPPLSGVFGTDLRDEGRRTDGAALAAIVLAGLALRVIFASLPRAVRWDEAAYQLIARSLLAGQGYFELVGGRDLQQPPVVAYLSLLGEWLRLPPAWATAAIAHVLLGALLALPVYGLAQDIYGRRVGLIAALLTALHPALVASPLYWGTMTEPPYMLFILSGVYAAWRATAVPQGGWRWMALLGVTTGLAYLTRPEALVYLALMCLFVIASRASRASRSRRGWLLGPEGRRTTESRHFGIGMACLAIVVFMLVASPYLIYLHRVTGRWAFSGKQGVTMDIAWASVTRNQALHDRAAASLDPAGREVLWLSPMQFDRTMSGWIAEDPRRFVRLVRQNVVDTIQALFSQDLFTSAMGVLLALGLFARPWTRARARGELLLLLALAPLASLWAFFVLSRFLAIVVPIGLIWAAVGIDHLAGWLEATMGCFPLMTCPVPSWPPSGQGVEDPRQGDAGVIASMARAAARSNLSRASRVGSQAVLLRALPLIAVAVGLLAGGVGVVQREQPLLPSWRVDVAHYLMANVPAGSPIMTRNSEVPLYAGLPMVAFPNAEWPEVRAYGLARGAAYLVVEEKEITDIRPQMSALLDTSNPQPLPGLVFVARLSGLSPDPGRATLIFRFEAGP